MDFVQATVHAAGRPLLVVGICLASNVSILIATVKLAESSSVQGVASGACVFAALWVCSMGSI